MTESLSPLRNRRQALAIALGLAAVAGSTGAASAQRRRKSIAGQVMYRERMMLPPGAMVEVSLLDVSLADAPSRTIARTRKRAGRGSPIPYRLMFDPALIRPRHTYALSARITLRGELLFISDEANHINPLRDGSEDIRVVRAGRNIR